MNDYDKLEWIHCAIQEIMVYDDIDKIDYEMLQKAISFVEDLREPYLEAK